MPGLKLAEPVRVNGRSVQNWYMSYAIVHVEPSSLEVVLMACEDDAHYAWTVEDPQRAAHAGVPYVRVLLDQASASDANLLDPSAILGLVVGMQSIDGAVDFTGAAVQS